jgi:C1q domain-containing protein
MTCGSNTSGNLYQTSLANASVVAADSSGQLIPGTPSGGVTGPVSSTNNAIATWNGTTGSALLSPPTPLVSSGGVMTNSNQPAFLAFVSSNTGSVTGDGTQVVVPFNATSFDQTSSFNTGSNYYVCPTTGIYQFNVNLNLQGASVGTNTGIFAYLYNGASVVNYISYGNTFSLLAGDGATVVNGSFLIHCTATNQISVQVAVYGNASKNVVIFGANPGGSCISGFLVA